MRLNSNWKAIDKGREQKVTCFPKTGSTYYAYLNISAGYVIGDIVNKDPYRQGLYYHKCTTKYASNPACRLRCGEW